MSEEEKEIKLNKYKYKIIYRNHIAVEGILEVEDMDKVCEVFMLNNFTQFENGSKAYYYNRNEIQQISVEKVEE